MRTGQYGGGEEQEMLTYGPESYVPGDRCLVFHGQMKKSFEKIISNPRYDELGEGRASASNSDQTGTLPR